MSASSEKKRRMEEREQGVDKRSAVKREAEEQAKKTQLKWRLAYAGIALFVVLSLVLSSSLPFRMTAVKVGNTAFSAAEMNYFYNNALYDNSQYMNAFGVQSNVPLQNQNCVLMENGTWHDYLLEQAISSAQGLEAMYQAAVAAGYELSEAGKEELNETLEALPGYAKQYGYKNVDKYLQAIYGSGVTEKIVTDMITKGTLVSEFAEAKLESMTYTDSELLAYFNEHADDYVAYDILQYYIAAETEEVTDENGETVKKPVAGGVEQVLADAKEIASKSADKASFEAAVAEYKDGATVSPSNGLVKSGMNTLYGEWVTDASRKTGDVETFSNDNGAYVVMFMGMEDQAYKTVAMRHILVKSVDEDEDGVYSEEELAKALAKVQEIEAEWLAGPQTEEAFAALAETYTEDDGSKENGGLYEDIGKGRMVAEINDFLFADGRKVGDTAILHGNNGGYDGYHLVLFVGEGREYRLILAENGKMSEEYTAWQESLLEGFETSNGMGLNLIGK